jgi:HEAT repeat protein
MNGAKSALPGYLRVRAITYFVQLGKQDCLQPALDLLNSDPGSREQVLSLLPQFKHIPKEDSDEVLQAVTKSLGDESGAVRMQAGMSLARLANPSAVPYLENAVAREQDDVVRSELQVSLEQLLKKTRK